MASSAPHAPRAPRGQAFLGGYEVVRRIAVGGMAEVLLAQQRFGTIERPVVIKSILPHLAEDAELVEMFLAEARLAALLQHPNIAQIYDVTLLEERPCIVMELLHGVDLKALFGVLGRARKPLDPVAVAAIGVGAAQGLGYAHRRRGLDGRPLGIVHRDVSPHNLFVTRDGVVKVLDFGIAKSAAQLQSTRSGVVKGKVPYMSPEQIQGGALDGRSDLFGLGVVLWELATGRRLFQRPTEILSLQAVLGAPVEPPSRLSRDVPEALDRAILRALSRDPAERSATGEEMAEELDALLRSVDASSTQMLLARLLETLVPDEQPVLEIGRSKGDGTEAEETTEDLTSSQMRAFQPPPQGSDAMTGQQLGQYRILAPIGRGGMGTVFHAVQQPIGRPVALKVIQKSLARDRDTGTRFLREARIASSLTNPHTVTIHDFGQADDGTLYLAMEMLEGEDLAQRIEREGALPVQEASAIAAAVCRSLSEAHRKGIVHRDVKPENIFLATTDEGETTVKVLDYGLARLSGPAGGDTRLTREGVLFGTPRYMSPEQVRGREVDARSDMYSLGVVLFEMLTGVPPFDDNDPVTIMAAHATSAPPDPSRTGARPELPADLRQLLRAALAKDPAGRPDAAAALAVLRPLAGLATTSVSPVTGPVSPLPDATVVAAEAAARAARAADAVPTVLVPVVADPAVAAPVAAPARRARTWLAVVMVSIVLGAAGAFASWFASHRGDERSPSGAAAAAAAPVATPLGQPPLPTSPAAAAIPAPPPEVAAPVPPPEPTVEPDVDPTGAGEPQGEEGDESSARGQGPRRRRPRPVRGGTVQTPPPTSPPPRPVKTGSGTGTSIDRDYP